MWKPRLIALIVLAIGCGLAYTNLSAREGAGFLYKPFRLGLDLSGGTHLVYEADIRALPSAEVADAMSSLRGVIERRVNLFGVTEPVVQLEGGGLAGSSARRLIIELPGVSDVAQAIALIDKTPVLEFKTEAPGTAGTSTIAYVATPLTGRYLKHASVVFDQNSINPSVSLEFNKEGAVLFAEITRANVGKSVAIFLDGIPISAPVVNEEIRDGRAVISGQFTLPDAKELTRNLNLGALPVPITLVSTQTIGPSLGADVVNKGVRAGVIGFTVIALFLILFYRLPGFVAALALSIYVALMLALFRFIPITLTSAGIAGFILSMGLAVDANVLIFERMREELRAGKELRDAIEEGFRRAWLSIRDSNVSSIVTAIILFWFGESLIEGFALTFMLGVIVSMLSAILVTRVFLRALGVSSGRGITRFLFGSGLSR